MFQVFHHLGMAYNAYRVMQDSGLWTIDQKSMREFVEAWVEDRKAAKEK